jgi:hypothetical protein
MPELPNALPLPALSEAPRRKQTGTPTLFPTSPGVPMDGLRGPRFMP